MEAVLFELPTPPEPNVRLVAKRRNVVKYLADYLWRTCEWCDILLFLNLTYEDLEKSLEKEQLKIEQWLHRKYSWKRLVNDVCLNLAETLQQKT